MQGHYYYSEEKDQYSALFLSILVTRLLRSHAEALEKQHPSNASVDLMMRA